MQATELSVEHVGYPVVLKFKDTTPDTSVTTLAGTLVSFADHVENEENDTEAGRVVVVDVGRIGPDTQERFLVLYDRNIESVEVA